MADLKQIKVGNTTYNIEPYTNYLPLAGGHMSGDIKMTENSTSIIFRSASADWYSGIYANSTGDEVLGIVVSNPRTHIMLGNADVSERPACTALTPAIDIKNGKVGINKRLGTDGSNDAGSYNLDVNGNSRINGDLTVTSGSVNAQDGLTSAGDLEIDGDAKIGGQIVGACLLNSTEVTLSNASGITIPLNSSQLKINTSTSYLHRGPTGTYTIKFPSSSCQVVTSSTSNMGTAKYTVGSTVSTQSNLSGTAQGGGSTFNAAVTIPAKDLSVYLTYGSSYTISVTYTKSSNVTSITTTGVYASEGIYAYPTSSTASQGTIGIGVGDSGSPYVYRGQTNIGGTSNPSYEVTIGAAGKTYTYLSSPTGTWSYASDKRDKTDIELINSSLHFINKLQPVTYVENMRENYINDDGTFNQESHQMGVLKKHRRRAGFLAQDVYELLKKEYGTDNYASVVDYNRYKQEDEGVFDRYSFNGVQLIPFLVKAIQEQQDIIESLEEKINLLEEKIQKEVN